MTKTNSIQYYADDEQRIGNGAARQAGRSNAGPRRSTIRSRSVFCHSRRHSKYSAVGGAS